MSKQPLPFAEAKSCNDLECTFCPCGAVRFSLHGATLHVNGREVMVPHRNLMCRGLQPSVPVAATLCAGSCNSPSVRHWPQAAAPRLTAR